MGAPWLPSDPPMVTMCPHGRTAKGGLGIQRHGKTPYTNKGVTVDSKSNALTAARAYLKKMGGDFANIMVEAPPAREPLPHIPTGIDPLDTLFGGKPNEFGVVLCPGLPRGRVSQMWSAPKDPGDTKNAPVEILARQIITNVVRNGGSVAYIDGSKRGKKILGEIHSSVRILKPKSLKDALRMATQEAMAGTTDLIVFGSLEGFHYRGEQGCSQHLWSQELPNLKHLLAKTQACVLGFGHTRVVSSPTETMVRRAPFGGSAWKFYTTLRLEVHHIPEGLKVRAVKWKLGRIQGRETTVPLGTERR
jgi:RecA/RadA recombinase